MAIVRKKPTLDPGLDTVPKLFHAQVEKYGDRVAMREKVLGLWREISWNQYRDNVHRAAAGMLKLGLQPGQCVSILSENLPEWLFCDIACLCLGGITVGIYTTSSTEELAYILGDNGSRILFVENEEQLDKALAARADLPELAWIIVYDMEGLRNFKDPMVMSYDDFLQAGTIDLEASPDLIETRWPNVKPSDIALIVYTSGTTGPPKGAMLTHDNVTWTSRAVMVASPAAEGDEVLSFLPLCHVAERNMSTFCAMTYGFVVNFAESLDTVPENIREISPHTFFAVPRIWEKFYSSIILTMQESTWLEKKVYNWAVDVGKKAVSLRSEGKPVPLGLRIRGALAHFLVFENLKRKLGLERAEFVTSGAAPIAPDILLFFHAVGIDVREAYGQTESTGPATFHQGDDIKLGTVGSPVDGVSVRLDDDGEILISGKCVFAGYYNKPELTSQTVKNGWLHTGDVGLIDEAGHVSITDRKKDIIITSGGKNITPSYIENKLKFSPYIHDAVVIGDGRKYLTALIMIDKENVTQFAQDARVPFTTFKSLCGNPDIGKLIENEVAGVNRTLARVEKIKKFRLIDVELTSDDPELTATMKLKRKTVNERFSPLIEAMY